MRVTAGRTEDGATGRRFASGSPWPEAYSRYVLQRIQRAQEPLPAPLDSACPCSRTATTSAGQGRVADDIRQYAAKLPRIRGAVHLPRRRRVIACCLPWLLHEKQANR